MGTIFANRTQWPAAVCVLHELKATSVWPGAAEKKNGKTTCICAGPWPKKYARALLFYNLFPYILYLVSHFCALLSNECSKALLKNVLEKFHVENVLSKMRWGKDPFCSLPFVFVFEKSPGTFSP
jgi:hypothetical protein